MSALAEARAVHETDPAKAYELLLTHWQIGRDVRVAAVLDALSSRVHPIRKIKGNTVGEKHDAWRALALEGRPEDLPTLVAEVASFGAWEGAHERLLVLAEVEPTPTIASLLTKLLLKPPYPREDSLPFWETVLAMLARTFDRRAADALEKAPAWPGSARMIRTMKRNFTTAAMQIRERAASPKLSEDEERALDELEGAYLLRSKKIAGPSDADSFLRRIAEDPTDDAMRLVFADWLLERGDPRGELIQLQYRRREGPLDEASARREAQLIRKHRKEWMGRLADATGKHPVRFERGFPSEVGFAPKYVSALASLTGVYEWATIESIELASVASAARATPALLLDPVMRSLRTVRGIDHGNLLAVLEARELPWESLAYRLWGGAGSAELADLARLPRLMHLTITSTDYRPEPWEWLTRGGLLSRLRTLTLHNGVATFSYWFRIVTQRETTLDSLTVAPTLDSSSGLWAFTLRRDDEGEWSRLHVATTAATATHLDEARMQLPPQILGLPKPALTELTFDESAEALLDERTRQRLRAHAG